MNVVTAALVVVGEALGFIKKRNQDKNAADVKAAQIKQDVQDEKARITTDVARGDADAVRRDLAE